MTGEDSLALMIRRYPALGYCEKEVWEAAMAIIDCFENSRKILACGNGGGCADADHMVGELMKSFEKKRPLPENFKASLQLVSTERGSYLAENLQNALPAISLCSHTSLLTAISNDMDADLIYSQQLAAYGRKGDVLFAITTSGNSRNVVDAAITAKAKGLRVIGLTGQHGGMIKQYCDTAICVPATTTAEIQEYHLPVYHTICRIIENRFF
ncbi:MAG: SIS domain-containing protein [Bacteroidales bacterium]|nr:SIS domain-containing protein [Bacteroidales bacterium]